MTKPTLDDFIKNPNKAMRDGYYPDFMSCLALEASYFGIKSLIVIKDEFIQLLRQEAILFPIAFLAFIFLVFLVITTPLLFPIWTIFYWHRTRKAFKRYQKNKNNKPKLMIEGVEQ